LAPTILATPTVLPTLSVSPNSSYGR
jgi:hypothetical protein